MVAGYPPYFVEERANGRKGQMEMFWRLAYVACQDDTVVWMRREFGEFIAIERVGEM